MSWTQLMAAWGMEIGLSAPVAGTLGVVAAVIGPVLVISAVMGGLEAWAASMRRTPQPPVTEVPADAVRSRGSRRS